MVKILGKDPEQDSMLYALQEAMEQVKKGRVKSLGVALAFEDGPAHVIGGTNAAILYLGCAMMMDEIKERCRKAEEEKVERITNAIIMPRKRQ